MEYAPTLIQSIQVSRMQGLPVSEYKDEMDKAPPSHKYCFRRAKKVILPDMKVCAFRQVVAGLE